MRIEDQELIEDIQRNQKIIKQDVATNHFALRLKEIQKLQKDLGIEHSARDESPPGIKLFKNLQRNKILDIEKELSQRSYNEYIQQKNYKEESRNHGVILGSAFKSNLNKKFDTNDSFDCGL